MKWTLSGLEGKCLDTGMDYRSDHIYTYYVAVNFGGKLPYDSLNYPLRFMIRT
ncbi:hypothetical protein HanPSC8_Chr08g0311611 [Helianthus annuus]|nr:hypothetical protein HanPSC8_Chr08g0311591 [Helianthus annuus]KAJ0900235.1 hypothetical protein HanPSC8_Chr08g0311611 [Helianthus annuus]